MLTANTLFDGLRGALDDICNGLGVLISITIATIFFASLFACLIIAVYLLIYTVCDKRHSFIESLFSLYDKKIKLKIIIIISIILAIIFLSLDII